MYNIYTHQLNTYSMCFAERLRGRAVGKHLEEGLLPFVRERLVLKIYFTILSFFISDFIQ